MTKLSHQVQIFATAFAATALLFACSEKKKPALMELMPPEKTGIDFSNVLREDERLNIITFEYFYNGAGVGVGDVNNDGLQDIFLAANISDNHLYLNKGNFEFEDITKSSGLKSTGKWATGVSIVDINQDGFLDIYVCYAGPFLDSARRANELYINNGDNTFTEKATEYGLADTGHSVQAAFFDYDRDGDLDVYILTNITDQTGPNVIRPKRVKGEMPNTDRLYRNNGNNTFTNVSAEAGITIEGYGLGVSICDINSDGWPDIYASNDYLSNDLLYINNRDGTFTDRLSSYFKHTSYSAMGNDISDINNDGRPDVITVDMLPPDNKRQKMMFGSTNYDRYRSEMQYGYTPQFMRNTMQLNDGADVSGQPLFSEIGQLAGIEATDWSWSPLMADVDNDGWKDLLITNGYARDITNRDFVNYRMQEFLQEKNVSSRDRKLFNALKSIEGAHIPVFSFRNNHNLTFDNQSTSWGFTAPAYSTGAAYADLDNDGDLDYITNNINEPASVFQNHSSEAYQNHFLNIDLHGPKGNLNGYGAKVFVYMFGGEDSVQYQEKSPVRGYLSTVEQKLHFGLGKKTTVDSVRVWWPDGRIQVLKQIKAGQTLAIKHDQAELPGKLPILSNKNGLRPSLFTRVDKNLGINFIHHETEYADFKIQPLLPHKYSEDGPGIAVGDVNGDGLDDFFIGGAFKQSGMFFIQNLEGNFTSKALISQTKYEEDLGVLLFDADGDQDNDLIVVSGGNEFANGSGYYQDRLYINDGRGNFLLDPQALPPSTASGSCVIAADYDVDGDLDLFIGGRLTPQHYPRPGQSSLLRNDKGHFTDVTDQVAPGLRNVGMVTGALWTDVDNDHQIDLIVVGEWMPITIFKNDKGVFHSDQVGHSMGWWNSIQGADIDEDGDTDYILGNLGLNTRYKASVDKPVGVYVGDFNQDGSEDAILSRYIDDVSYPAHPRDDIFQQIVQLKKKYQSYKAYADATMESLLEGFPIKPVSLQSETFATSYLENKGKDGWKLSALPTEAQYAPVCGITVDDFNHDGHDDVILVGNTDAPDVLTGRYDASKGLLLQGDGKGNLKPRRPRESGLLVDGNARSLTTLRIKNVDLLLAAQNNDTLKVFANQRRTPTIRLKDSDVYAIISHSDGKKSKHEFYFGDGYLSQSSRSLTIPINATEITIFDNRGSSRTIPIPKH